MQISTFFIYQSLILANLEFSFSHPKVHHQMTFLLKNYFRYFLLLFKIFLFAFSLSFLLLFSFFLKLFFSFQALLLLFKVTQKMQNHLFLFLLVL